MTGFGQRCGAVALGLALDRALGEPPTALHPVAGFGTAMSRIEAHLWRDQRSRGAVYTGIGVVLGLAAGTAVRSTAAIVAVASAGRELRRVAEVVEHALHSGGLDAARKELPSLVGRDPSTLDEQGIAAAVIESVAENSVDAVVAPVLWGLVAGAPGAAAYRAINTMDAMVGHRSDRYENFGWASARLDDLANYVPARLFAALVVTDQWSNRGEIIRLTRRDAGAHPSPNAGVAETAVAAAIGRQLGGQLRYGDRVEDRPTLGDGPRPAPTDIARAISLSQRTETALACGLAAIWLVDRLVSPCKTQKLVSPDVGSVLTSFGFGLRGRRSCWKRGMRSHPFIRG